MKDATIKREFITAHNGMKTAVWEQHLDGIPVFQASLIGHVTKNGELVNISSTFLPNVQQAANLTPRERAELQTGPPVSAREAVVRAAQNIGEQSQVDEVVPRSDRPEGAERQQAFNAPGLKNVHARLVWLPLNRSSLRLCWSVELAGRARDEVFRILIDVNNGHPLVRQSLTAHHHQPASYKVFTGDSPSPLTPGHPTPSSAQPSTEFRSLVTTISLSSVASPNGWINDGGNETVGNNVDARLDLDGNDETLDSPRPNGGTNPDGSPRRLFDFPLDLAQPPSSYRDAAVVNAFYWCNWMHDRLYELGFTEAAGNFQSDNFGRGGMGNDAVQVDVQDGDPQWINRANFYTPTVSDGPNPYPARLTLGIWDAPNPDRDSSFDAQVILHE